MMPLANLKHSPYPDGKQVLYSYDAAGQLIQVEDWANRITQYTYDAAGRLSSTIHSNGLITYYSYDAVGQLTSQSTVSTSNQEIIQYDFSYNDRGQLIQESGFDSLQGLPLNLNMTYGSDNIVRTLNSQALTFDADGNMTQGWLKGTLQHFSYDQRNRLTQQGTTSYQYNSDNHRIIKIEDNTETRYVVNPLPALEQVMMETDNNNIGAAWNVYGLGLIGRQQSDGTYVTYHYDYRGSTIALTNISGDITDRYYYTPFGQMSSHQGNTQQPFAYNGRDGVLTDSNGLYYMRARYYNPDMRRFVNRDVLLGNPLQSQSINRYAYVQGNPVIAMDPSGHCPMCVTAGIGAGIGAIFGAATYGLNVWIDDSKSFDWVDFAGATAGGAVGGAVAGLTGGIGGGAAAGFASSVTDKIITVGFTDKTMQSEDYWDIGLSTVIGGGLGALGAAAKGNVPLGKSGPTLLKESKYLVRTTSKPNGLSNQANRYLRSKGIKPGSQKKFIKKYPTGRDKRKLVENLIAKDMLKPINIVTQAVESYPGAAASHVYNMSKGSAKLLWSIFDSMNFSFEFIPSAYANK